MGTCSRSAVSIDHCCGNTKLLEPGLFESLKPSRYILSHFIAISNVCLPKGHLLRPYAVFELPKLHPGYHKRPFEENKHQMSTNFTPARSTILKKNKTKQKHHFQGKKSTRLAQHLHQKNPLNKISVWNSFLEHNPS